MNFFHYNIVVVAYPVFVYVISRAGRQVELASLHEKQRKSSYFQHVILARNYMCSLMMISDMLSKHVGAVKVF